MERSIIKNLLLLLLIIVILWVVHRGKILLLITCDSIRGYTYRLLYIVLLLLVLSHIWRSSTVKLRRPWVLLQLVCLYLFLILLLLLLCSLLWRHQVLILLSHNIVLINHDVVEVYLLDCHFVVGVLLGLLLHYFLTVFASVVLLWSSLICLQILGRTIVYVVCVWWLRTSMCHVSAIYFIFVIGLNLLLLLLKNVTKVNLVFVLKAHYFMASYLRSVSLCSWWIGLEIIFYKHFVTVLVW